MRLNLYKFLTEKLSTTRSSLNRFASTAPQRYKVYSIPKRTSGYRTIAHPSKDLKQLQRELNNFLRPLLAIHPVAFAYQEGKGIKDNAIAHLGTKYLLKMDFNNFFNSITPDLFFNACKSSGLEISEAEKNLLENLLFWNKTQSNIEKLVLSVGAPSSPLISNFVMFSFDDAMYDFCKNNKINYTRYADDITFSTNIKNKLFTIPQVVKTNLEIHSDCKININELKTVFSSKAHNRHITGINITNDNKISVGRDRKRVLSSMIHKFTLQGLSKEDMHYLQGLAAFVFHIEPIFRERMETKYSINIVDEILKLRIEREQ